MYMLDFKEAEEPEIKLLTFIGSWRKQRNSRKALEKAMAPHSSTLAWKIPWMEESGRLRYMGLLRVGHD